jgi:hypothetical protein
MINDIIMYLNMRFTKLREEYEMFNGVRRSNNGPIMEENIKMRGWIRQLEAMIDQQ